MLKTPILIALLISWCAFAAPRPLSEITNPKSNGQGYVSNPDGILTASEIDSLNFLATQIENTTNVQIAVVVINSCNVDETGQYALDIFNTWGVGNIENNNGVLVFTAVNQRAWEIIVGDGISSQLTHVKCAAIGDEIKPYFRNAQYGAGIAVALRSISMIVSPSSSGNSPDDNRSSILKTRLDFQMPSLWWFIPFFYLVGNLIFSMRILFFIRRCRNSSNDPFSCYMAVDNYLQWGWALFFVIPGWYLMGKLTETHAWLRNCPRNSQRNGKPMYKLSEKDDDLFLDAGQLTEEDIGSKDYDVWITDNGDDVLILSYAGKKTKYDVCKKCNYKTWVLQDGYTEKPATTEESGLRISKYACLNCHHVEKIKSVIPKIMPVEPTSRYSSHERFYTFRNSFSSRSSGISLGSSTRLSSRGGSSSWGGGSSRGSGSGGRW